MNGQQKILSMYAYIAVDDDGTEGVVATTQNGITMPLVGADLAMVAHLDPLAQAVATHTGRRVTLAHFSVRTNQKVIEP